MEGFHVTVLVFVYVLGICVNGSQFDREDGTMFKHWRSHIDLEKNSHENERIQVDPIHKLPKRRFESVKDFTSYAKNLLKSHSRDLKIELDRFMRKHHNKMPAKSEKPDLCPDSTQRDSRSSVLEHWRNLNNLVNRDDTESCPACTELFQILQNLACGSAYDELEALLIFVCEVLMGDASEMCDGTISMQGPYVYTTLTQVTPHEFCETLNMCFPPADNQRAYVGERMARIMQHRESSARDQIRDKIQSRKSVKTELKIIQLADIHMQTQHAINSSTDCGLFVCCLESNGPGNARPYGEYSCNIPERTMNIFLDKVADLNPDFVIFAGDSPPHTLWDETLASQINCSSIVAKALTDRIPGKNVYPNIGNHEMYPTNIYSKDSNDTIAINSAMVDIWTSLAGFGQGQKDSMNDLGYYTMMSTINKLRILSINTNHYWYTLNFVAALNRNTTAEAVHREFIVNTLTQARNNSEKVIVIGHHPVGAIDSIVRATRWWEQVALDFSDVIVLHISGHTHNDEFHLFLDPETDKPKSVNFVAPSMTSNSDVNPSMREFYLDPDTLQVTNYLSYFIKLDDQRPDTPPPVELNYNAKDVYKLEDFTLDSWLDLTVRLIDDNELFQVYYSNRFARAINPTCTGDCKKTHICNMWFPNYDEANLCVDIWNNPPTGPPPGSSTTPEVGSGNGLKSSTVLLLVALVAFLSLL